MIAQFCHFLEQCVCTYLPAIWKFNLNFEFSHLSQQSCSYFCFLCIPINKSGLEKNSDSNIWEHLKFLSLGQRANGPLALYLLTCSEHLVKNHMSIFRLNKSRLERDLYLVFLHCVQKEFWTQNSHSYDFLNRKKIMSGTL